MFVDQSYFHVSVVVWGPLTGPDINTNVLKLHFCFINDSTNQFRPVIDWVFLKNLCIEIPQKKKNSPIFSEEECLPLNTHAFCIWYTHRHTTIHGMQTQKHKYTCMHSSYRLLEDQKYFALIILQYGSCSSAGTSNDGVIYSRLFPLCNYTLFNFFFFLHLACAWKRKLNRQHCC